MQYFLFFFIVFHLCGLFAFEFNPQNGPQSLGCINDKECQNFIKDSQCLYNKCSCKSDELLSSDATQCLMKVKEYGSPCVDNVQCSDVLSYGGICHENKCSCKNGYHYLRGFCWKNVGLNEECITDEQCFSSYEYVGFKCNGEVGRNSNIQKVCQCRSPYYQRMNLMCRRKRYNEESCNLDEDCDENECEGMKCKKVNLKSNTSEEEFSGVLNGFYLNKNTRKMTCSKGMFKINGNCVLELGMPCKSNSQCNHIPKALCLDNLNCACEPVLFVASEDNRECLSVVRAKINDISKASCKKNPQCGVFGPHSYCDNQKRCKCKSGSYFDVETKFCWPIKSLNEKCLEDKDCHSSETNAYCRGKKFSGKKCLCQDGYHQKGLKCIPNALKVGDPCEDHEECFFPNSLCNDSNFCVCKENHYFENARCEPGVGSECSDDKNCSHLKNTECKIGNFEIKQCLCIKNYTNSKDKKYCLPVADYHEKCEESFQCEFQLGPFGICKNQTCECREEAHYSGRKCHKSKYVGESCSKKLDCFSGNDTKSVICLKGICSCNYDYELVKNETCLKTNSANTAKFYLMSLMFPVFFFIVR